MKEEYLIMLMDAYVKGIERDDVLYDIGEKTGMFITFETDPYNKVVEDILSTELNDDVCSALYDFATDGYVTLKNKEDQWIDVKDIKMIYDIYKGVR